MASSATKKQLIQRWAIRGIVGVGVFGVSLWGVRMLVAHPANPIAQILHAYSDIGHRIQLKLDKIRKLEEENSALKLESAQLRQRLALLEFGKQAEIARNQTEEVRRQLASQTGSGAGTTVRQISYRPPSALSTSQLYTLGVSYFKTREDEKAAVILQTLVKGDDRTFKAPKVLSMAAVAWYRLNNFNLAGQYFDQILELEAGSNDEVLRFQAQARVWKGLIAERLGKRSEAQKWFRQVVELHPHSHEARWINERMNTEVKRVPASSNRKSRH